MRIQKGKTINPDNYVGMRVKIDSARIETMKFGPIIRLLSEVIPFKGDDKLTEDKSLRASKILGLGQDDNGELFVIEDSKAHKFFLSKKIVIKTDYKIGDNINELIGVQCIVQKTEDGFLELS